MKLKFKIMELWKVKALYSGADVLRIYAPQEITHFTGVQIVYYPCRPIEYEQRRKKL